MDFNKIELKEFVDIPNSTPKIRMTIPKVGISQRPCNIQVLDPFDSSRTIHSYSDIRISCSLNPNQRGLHMSRIEECIEELKNAGLSLHDFVKGCASLIQKTQGQKASKIDLISNYEKANTKNPSGVPSKEIIQLISSLEVIGEQQISKLGVVVPFINACPCTQRWGMREYYNILREKGYDHSTSEDLVRCAPLQAHTNRGTAKLIITDENITHQEIYDVLDRSVPIIRELLKGQDEHSVVRHAHQKGQFCEDNIRAIASEVATTFKDTLPPSTDISIYVEVDESVHFHNLWAEMNCNLEELCS